MKNTYALLTPLLVLFLSGCAGIKVINPNDPAGKDKGTKMVDWSGGAPKVVSTHSCHLKSGGKRFSALGKNEDEARKEVLARCQDATLISFCKAEDVRCEAN